MSDLVKYQLVRPFWNGRALLAKGEVCYFPLGRAPKGSLLLEQELDGDAVSIETPAGGADRAPEPSVKAKK